jgi:ATP-dependent helicase/nuclease subunit B
MIYNIGPKENLYSAVTKYLEAQNKNNLSNTLVITPSYAFAHNLKKSFTQHVILPKITTLEALYESAAIKLGKFEFIKFKTKSIIKIYKKLAYERSFYSINAANRIFDLINNKKSSLDSHFEYIKTHFQDLDFYHRFQKLTIDNVFDEYQSIVVAGFNLIDDELIKYLFSKITTNNQVLFIYGAPKTICGVGSHIYLLQKFLEGKSVEECGYTEPEPFIPEMFFDNDKSEIKQDHQWQNVKLGMYENQYFMMHAIANIALKTFPDVALVTQDDQLLEKIDYILGRNNISVVYKKKLISHPDGLFLLYIMELLELPKSGKALLQLLKHKYIYANYKEEVDAIECNYIRKLRIQDMQKEVCAMLGNDEQKLLFTIQQELQKFDKSSDLAKTHLEVAQSLSVDFTYEGAKILRLMSENNLGYHDIKEYKENLIFFLCNSYYYPDKLFKNVISVFSPKDAVFLMQKNILLADFTEETFSMEDSKFVYNFYHMLNQKNVFIFCNQQEFTSKLVLKMQSICKIQEIQNNVINFNFSKAKNYSPIEKFNLEKKDIPKILTATMIEYLVNDPYQFYLKYILKIKDLEPIDKKPSYAEFGNLVHLVAQKCKTQKVSAQFLVQEFTSAAQIYCNNFFYVKSLWIPRFAKMATYLAQFHNDRLQDLHKIETESEYEIKIFDFIIKARLDRIEFLKDGNISIIDFKTGSVPTVCSVQKLLKPQILVQAMVASQSSNLAVKDAMFCKLEKNDFKTIKIKKIEESVLKLHQRLEQILQ